MSYQATPLLSLPVTLSGTVAAHRFVTAAGAQAGAGANALGVARSAGVSGDSVTVDSLGTAVVEAGAAVSLGDDLKSDASGRAITWATSGARLGVALQAASGAGVMIEIRMPANPAA